MSTGVIDQSANRRRRKPSAAKSWLKAIELTSRIEADPRRLFADMVEDWSERQPDCPGLISETETFSYRALAAGSIGTRAGRYRQGLKPAIPFAC